MQKKDLEVQEKQELNGQGEQTFSGKFYLPRTDIYETEQALMLIMDMPGVTKEHIHIHLEKDKLDVMGQVQPTLYEGMRPVHTEYNIGHFKRSFTLSNKIDQDSIEATMQEGVLTLKLPKKQESQPRKIKIQ